jgi:hypothetical protein
MTNPEGSDRCGTKPPHVTIGGASAFPNSSFVINSSFGLRDFYWFIRVIRG